MDTGELIAAIVIFMLSVVFIIVGLSLVFQSERIVLLEIPLIGATIIYAVVSSVTKKRQ